MIYIFALLLMGLVAINLQIGKSILYPPALFSAIWATALCGLVVTGSRFDSLSSDSLIVFLIGPLAMTVGGALARTIHRPAKAKLLPLDRHRYVQRILNIGIGICLAGIPFFYERAVSYASNSIHRGFWIALRSEDVARTAGVTPFSVLDNLNVFSIIVALIAFYEMDGTRKRRWIAILAVSMAIVYGALTGAKSSISIIPILLIIRWLKVGRPSTPTLVVTVSLCVILFMLGCIFVNLYYLSDRLGPTELVVEAAMLPANYLLGSLVAFDKVLTRQYVIQYTQGMARGFLEIARKLGANIDIPQIHAQYVTISDYENTNLYTIYFSYIPDIGLAGTALWMTILGVILVTVYRGAVRQDPVAVIMYGMLAYGLVLSIQAERFLLGINQYGKTLGVLFLLYRCPQFRIRKLRVSMSSSRANRSLEQY